MSILSSADVVLFTVDVADSTQIEFPFSQLLGSGVKAVWDAAAGAVQYLLIQRSRKVK